MTGGDPKRRRAALAAALQNSAAAKNEEMMEREMKIAKLHALLIGINCYLPNRLPNGLFYNNLLGCVPDILRMEAFLSTRLGVPKENIVKLTSSNDGKGRPTEDPSQWPTYENIVKALQKLTKTAQPGDQVFIHYSGHGGRAKTTKQFRKLKEKDGIDEVLVPMDLGNSEGRYLRDTEMHFLLKKMVDRKLIVTVVLDSCHASGQVRGPGVRGIGVVDTTERPTDSLVASPEHLVEAWEAQSKRTGTRDALVGSGWLLEPKGFVLIAACRTNEFANEHPFEKGVTNGALTYWLVDSLKRIGPGFTYKMLHDRVLAKVHSEFVSQTPQLEGEGNRVVFGSNESLSQYAVTVIKVNSDRTITLNAGQAHGVWPSSWFNVFRLHEKDLINADRSIALVEVTDSGAVESQARIVKQFAAQTPESGCQAVLLDLGPVRIRRHVSLVTMSGVDSESEQMSAMKKIAETVARRPDGFVKLTANDEAPDFVVKVGNDTRAGGNVVTKGISGVVTTGASDGYLICDPNGNEMPNLRPPLSIKDENAPAMVVQRLVHLARYTNVRELDNNDPQSPLARKLLVDLLGWQKSDVTGKKARPKPFEGSPKVKHGDLVFMRVRNKYSQVLNLTVLDLQPDWGISKIYPKGAGEFEIIEPGRDLELPIRFTLPDGYDSGIDIIKVFATVEPTSFRWLELPALDHPEFGNKVSATSDNVRTASPNAPKNLLEEFLAEFSPLDSRTRQASVAVSSSGLWVAHQVEIEVRK